MSSTGFEYLRLLLSGRYFSWDDGLVHYIAISTEAWFGVGVEPGQVGVKEQFEWLKADLEKAQANRANVPWIVVHGLSVAF